MWRIENDFDAVVRLNSDETEVVFIRPATDLIVIESRQL